MDAIQNIMSRASVRQYSDREISEEALHTISLGRNNTRTAKKSVGNSVNGCHAYRQLSEKVT